MKFTVRDILKLEHLEFINRNKFKGSNKVSIDSRIVDAKDIFIAIKGENTDGHKFIDDVIKKNPSMIIVSELSNIGKSIDIPILLVKDTLQALGQLANIYRSKFKVKILAISGSNGKTTTKEMIAAILEQKYNVLKTEGNLNNQFGVPLTLFRLTKKTEIAIIEMGMNHFKELEYLCKIAEPDFGLLTNIANAHIEFFGSIQNIAKAKGELFEYLKNNSRKVYLNLDDKYVAKLGESINKKFTFSFKKKADVTGRLVKLNENGSPTIEFTHKNKTNTIQLKTFGKHTAYNALASIAIGIDFKVPSTKIIEALENFESYKNRMQIFKKENILILNDTYNANPDSVKAAIETLAYFKKSIKIAVLGDMLELGNKTEYFHRNIGEYLAQKKINKVLCLGEYAKYIFEQLQNTKTETYFFLDKNALIEKLKEMIDASSIILIKGSRRMKMEDITQKLLESN